MRSENLSSLPLVSVITPTYNRPHYLRTAISSAINQSYKNIEVIVSDNCSPTNPREIVDSFQDSRIRFVRNTTNLGMFVNTFQAFRMARGKYVASLLDDDMWEPNFLEKLIPPLEAYPDLTLAFCDHSIMDEQGQIDPIKTIACSKQFKRLYLREKIYRPFLELAIVDRSVSTAIAAVIRRSSIDWAQVPKEVGPLWDLYLSYLCSRDGSGAYYCPERLTRCREHAQTETLKSGRQDLQAKIRKATAELFVYEQFLKDARLASWHPYFQQKWGHSNTTLGIALMRERQSNQARQYFWTSLKSQFSLRSATAMCLSFMPPIISSRF